MFVRRRQSFSLFSRRPVFHLGGANETTSPQVGRQTHPRSAIIVVELLLMLPILLLLLAAVVEFGSIFAVMQNVSFASRMGAKFASQQTSGAAIINLVNNETLLAQVNRHLIEAGLEHGACRVLVHHNDVTSPKVAIAEPPSGACDCELPSLGLPSPKIAVRVTVCVPLEGNVPDLLSTFGFSLSDKQVHQSTTLRVEH